MESSDGNLRLIPSYCNTFGEGDQIQAEYKLTIRDDSGFQNAVGKDEIDHVEHVVTITLTGTNDAPTINGGPVSKDILESADADQTGVQLSDSGTFDVVRTSIPPTSSTPTAPSPAPLAPTPIPLSIRSSSMTSSTSALTPSSMRPQTPQPSTGTLTPA